MVLMMCSKALREWVMLFCGKWEWTLTVLVVLRLYVCRQIRDSREEVKVLGHHNNNRPRWWRWQRRSRTRTACHRRHHKPPSYNQQEEDNSLLLQVRPQQTLDLCKYQQLHQNRNMKSVNIQIENDDVLEDENEYHSKCCLYRKDGDWKF